MKSTPSILRLLSIPFVLALVPALSLANPTDGVRLLLEQGKDREAYELGTRNPSEMGRPFFDFFFGVAALNAGAPGEGVLALERYLLHFPNNRSARFHLARGYFILGEDQRAREEFEALIPDARDAEAQSISGFLDTIRARESRYKPTLTAHVEVGVGHDSNINSGVVAGQIAGLPAGYVVTPGQSSERISDALKTLTAGVQGTYPIAPGVALYGGASVATRTHIKAESDVFDQASVGLQAGVSMLKGRHLTRVGADITRLAVDNKQYLALNTVVADWQFQWDQFNRVGAAMQVTEQNYRNVTTFVDQAKTTAVASGADVRASRLTSVSAFWTRALVHDWNPSLTLGLNAGEDRNRRDRPDLSRDLAGLRVGLSLQPTARWTLGAALAYQGSRYQGDFASGISARRDRLYTLDIGATWALDRHWSLRGDYQRSDQRSNIGLYHFNRDAVAVKLRYETR